MIDSNSISTDLDENVSVVKNNVFIFVQDNDQQESRVGTRSLEEIPWVPC